MRKGHLEGGDLLYGDSPLVLGASRGKDARFAVHQR